MIVPAILINGLHKSFGKGKKKKMVVSNLNLSVKINSVYGFLGPNGAGKSTTIKALFNFLKPDSGEISIFGKKVGVEEYRDRIGYLSEFPFFYLHLTANETLLLSGRLSGMRKKELEKRIPELLYKMNLKDARHQKVGGFSKGMKQRLGMANALIHDPELLILDEPMSGLDPVGRYQMKEIILELKNSGKTIFFSSHILSDIEVMCDEIAIINKGVQIYSGNLKNFISNGRDLEETFIKIVAEANNAATL